MRERFACKKKGSITWFRRLLDHEEPFCLMEKKMSDAKYREQENAIELEGLQFASVELNLTEAQTGVITHLDNKTDSKASLSKLAELGAQGFSLVSVVPNGESSAVAFLQRPIQTERELHFIRNAFLLEDALQIAAEDLPKVVDAIEVDDLIIALKPASDPLRKAFFDALPEKASLALQEQIEFLMPKSLRAAEAAQERVLQKIKALLRAGEIQLKSEVSSGN